LNNLIFISYASEDYNTATKLYDDLKVRGYNPWLDKENLLPGQLWDNEIKGALRKSVIIILLLSKVSVSKRGYVQREYKLALDYSEEKLDSDIYIIPCKIDDCDVPEKLSQFQWEKLSEENYFDKIIRSIDFQLKKNANELLALNSKEFSFEVHEIKEIIQGSPNCKIDIEYPQFTKISDINLQSINSYIEADILQIYNQQILEVKSPVIDSPTIFESFNYEQQNYFEFTHLTKNLISFKRFSYSYMGGAHGFYGTTGYSYLLNPLKKLSIEYLMEGKVGVLSTLKILCEKELERIAKEEMNVPVTSFFLDESRLTLAWDTFNNFFVNKRGLIFLFGIYQFTPYSLGEHHVEIPYSRLLQYNPDLSRVTNLFELLRTE